VKQWTRMAKTPEGKKRSSQNAIRHGLRARNVLILPDETQEEYDATRRGWLATYEPDGYHETRLVEQLILNDWLLQRANRRMVETEASEDGGGDEHRVELMQRYKTANERAFYRALAAVEGLRKDILRNELLRDTLLAKNRRQIDELKKELATRPRKPETELKPERTKAEEVFQGQRSKKKRRKVTVLDQWVEVETGPDGKAVTKQYPSNEALIARGQALWPPPELVYRRFHFVAGVPEEYAWTTKDDSVRASGGMGIQRMTIETWLKQIEREKREGAGHLLPCGGNLPRPEERGGCDCPVCTKNRRIFETRAVQV
jgi:hypothetical protein